MSDSLGANHLKYRGKCLLLFHSDGFFCQSQNSQPYICQILPAQLEKICKRFENIKLEKTYVTAYFILCNYAHNNLAMLEHRQLEKGNGEHKVTFFKEEPFTVWVRFAMTLGATLVDSHKTLIDFFKKSLEDKSQAVCDRFTQLRKDAKDLFVNE